MPRSPARAIARLLGRYRPPRQQPAAEKFRTWQPQLTPDEAHRVLATVTACLARGECSPTAPGIERCLREHFRGYFFDHSQAATDAAAALGLALGER